MDHKKHLQKLIDDNQHRPVKIIPPKEEVYESRSKRKSKGHISKAHRNNYGR